MTNPLVGVVGLLTCGFAFAAQPEVNPVEAAAETSAPCDRLFGDWGGFRTEWEERGIEIGLSMTNIYQHNAHGGMQTHNGHRLTGSVDYELIFDLGALDLIEGGTFYVYGESAWNDGIGGDRVGNIFGVNTDAAGDISIVVDEAWYEQSLWDGSARFRIGKMDMGVDFDTNAYANDETAQFLHPALVNTGNIPFPDFGLGAQLVYEPCDWFYLGIGAVDAQGDGRETGFATAFHDRDDFFGVLELGLTPVFSSPRGELPGGYRVGLWYDPQPKDEIVDDWGGRRRTFPVKRDDVGFYFNMDQMLYKEVADDDADTQGLGFFLRYGFAHADANEMQHFWSIGCQYQGLLPTRDDDVLGFGFAEGIMGDKLRAQGGGSRESVYELYYNAAVNDWLSITPDFQFVVNPGANNGRDAFVAGLRVQMSF